MDILNLLIIVVVIIIIAMIYNHCKKIDNIKETQEEKPIIRESNKEIILLPTNKKKTIIKQNKFRKYKQNPYFSEIQFHTDYRDTQNAFQELIPNQRQLFNRSDLPLINVSEASKEDVNSLVKNFIKEVNKTLDTKVKDGITANNWKNNYGERHENDGWEKQQRRLGLPGSVYTDPLKKEHIVLVNIDRAERFENEDELRYTVFMIIQKPSAEDQLVLKVNFYIDKQDKNLDREFFDKNKNSYETKVMIEEIFIIGILTKHSYGKESELSKYYNFDGIATDGGRMFSQSDIVAQLNKKRKAYQKECKSAA